MITVTSHRSKFTRVHCGSTRLTHRIPSIPQTWKCIRVRRWKNVFLYKHIFPTSKLVGDVEGGSSKKNNIPQFLWCKHQKLFNVLLAGLLTRPDEGSIRHTYDRS